MRALVDSPEVQDLFPRELAELKEGVVGWKPVTKVLKEIKKRVSTCYLWEDWVEYGGKESLPSVDGRFAARATCLMPAPISSFQPWHRIE
jgi:hypothetical protein